jgi:type III secretory pathway component EscU
MNWLNAAFLVILIVLHYFSIGWMAESRSIEMIMTGGSFSEIGTISSVLGFILLRTTIVFILPGFMLSWLCMELIDFLLEKREFQKTLKREDT